MKKFVGIMLRAMYEIIVEIIWLPLGLLLCIFAIIYGLIKGVGIKWIIFEFRYYGAALYGDKIKWIKYGKMDSEENEDV